ncbi:uncharacterized protein K452DRAFT_361705 [Aplosporella prunicola CBS 121167]|uniref:Uncharacterized protein n=1 Tax=Aplosporella prunicola CBS 121167 TaxID=1176127 RepID=A0A6A6B0N4_9PEZI|nr:uncharacterized protein K452DRAFT_361705 [Aplosporella prunicola CBS 121167]KAF2137742.1 hypothetical protein K452DRAFT_361705 [Aplosporella prunicola CBS 121167]
MPETSYSIVGSRESSEPPDSSSLSHSSKSADQISDEVLAHRPQRFKNTRNEKLLARKTAGRTTPTFKDDPFIRLHLTSLMVLLLYGLLPLMVYFIIIKDPFVTRRASCSDEQKASKGSPNGFGFANMFTIDRVTGTFPFWVAKLIDTTWDLLVSRGLQFLAGLISYSVFSSALLQAIETSPIPYRTFIGISLNGASIGTIISLVRDLRRYKRWGTMMLFVYMVLDMAYVLTIPTLFSAMTGYTTSASPYGQLPGSGQLTSMDEMGSGILFHSLPGIENNTCVTGEQFFPFFNRASDQRVRCGISCNSDHLSSYVNNSMSNIASITGYVSFEDGNCWFYANQTYETQAKCDNQGHETKGCDCINNNITYLDSTKLILLRGKAYEMEQIDNSKRKQYTTDGASPLYLRLYYCFYMESGPYPCMESGLKHRCLAGCYLRGIFAIAAAAQGTSDEVVDWLMSMSPEEVEKTLYDKSAAVEFSLFEPELPYFG